MSAPASDSMLHRTPYALKLLALSVLGLATAFFSHTESLIGLLALAGALLWGYRIAGLPWAALRRPSILVSPAVLAAMLYHGIWTGVPAGLVTGATVSLVMLIGAYSATLLFLSTTLAQVGAELERSVSPLRRWGVKPERVGLTAQLLLGSTTALLGRYHRVHEAALVRGLGRNLRAHAAPLLVKTLAHATATAEALKARNLVDS